MYNIKNSLNIGKAIKKTHGGKNMKEIEGNMDLYHRNKENMKGIRLKKEGGEEKESK